MLRKFVYGMCAVVMVFVSATAAQAQAVAPTPTPTVSPDDIQACISQLGALMRFNGARPELLVLQDVDLLSQPQFGTDAKPLKLITIPKGARVVVFDLDNVQKSWFRVLWSCDTFNFAGWVPKSAIKFFDKNANPKVAPPACIKTLGTVDSMNNTWTSPVQGRIAVALDLYRKPSKNTYPESFFYLTRNGKELRDKDRKFETAGPFLLNGMVIGTDVSKGTVVGFEVIGPNVDKEPLLFFATIYLIVNGCQWNFE